MSADSIIPVRTSLDGQPLPLLSLLTNFSRKSQDEFFDLLESLDTRANTGAGLDETTRRKRLFNFFIGKQRQVGQVFALVRWLLENHVFLDRLRDLTAVLDRRTGLIEHTCESLQILQRRVEDRLYPLWDVFTALHVMGTGTYRLLPGIIETRLIEDHQSSTAAAGQPASNPLKPPITEEIISATTARLNNALHIKLLSTVLPVDLSHIDIRDGVAYLTYGNEFEIGVSLRMSPAPADAPYPPEPEESRVHWRLYDLKILMNVDQQTALTADLHHASATTTPLFNDSQLIHLNVLLNTIATGHPNPIGIMCTTMHRLCMAVLMDILHQQSVTLTKLFAMQDISIEYIQASKVLNIKYWSGMKEMPQEGIVSPSTITSKLQSLTFQQDKKQQKENQLLLAPCLQILIDTTHDRLSIRHNPPLPSASFPTLFSLDLSCISITGLLYNVLMQHGNLRIEQLFQWLARESREKGKKIVALMDMEVISKAEQHSPSTSNTSSKGKSPPSIVPRSYLLIRLLPGYTLRIHTDTQTGRFVMEWSAALESSTGEGAPHEQSNLAAFYGGPSSQMNRILHGENARLNQSIASVFEIILHLRMICLTHQIASVASKASSNPRVRVWIGQPPFNEQPAPGLPSAPAINQTLKHVHFDPVHYKQYSITPVPSNELFKRPGFGPYTTFLQLAGYSTNFFVILQLNPFQQCTPAIYLCQTELELVRPLTPPSAGVAAKPPQLNPFPVIRQLIDMKWPLATSTPTDPSTGFASELYRGVFSSILSEVEAVTPLLLLRRDLQTNFSFLVKEARVVSKIVDIKGVPLPTQLQQIVERRTAAVKQNSNVNNTNTADSADAAPAPHLIVGMNFPLSYSLYPPGNVNMDTLLDPSNPSLRQEAHAVIYATPPGFAPDTSKRNSPTKTPASSSAGFVVYFYHPLIGKIMAALKECESTASKTAAWIAAATTLTERTANQKWIFDSTGVVTLVYDSTSMGRVARLLYDLDNLYVHLCWLSNFIKQIENNILAALVSGSNDGLVPSDEIIEHDTQSGVNGGVYNGVVAPSSHIRATSLNPTYFPSDFYRCVEFSANQLTFAYVNPEASTRAQHPYCYIQITRDHRREIWKQKNMVLAHMYPISGQPPKSPLLGQDLLEYKITLLPNAWPQVSFYSIEFNTARTNNILTLLHNVWLAHRTMPPIWNFLKDVQRWQALGDLTTNHQLMRLYSMPTGSMVHCIPESSTRLRFLYGHHERNRTGEPIWRLKTDLRFIYAGEIVQDFKSGTVPRAGTPPGGNNGNGNGNAAGGSAPSAPAVRAGKIGGDFTQYLHRWYKRVAFEECKQSIKLAERTARGDALLSGARIEMHDSNDHSLSVPFVSLQFVPPTDATPSNSLTTQEQQVLGAYFAHRLACPPYLSEPITYFYRLIASSAANVQTSLKNLRFLVEAFALELLQPHQFPQAFPQHVEESLLRSVRSSRPSNIPTLNSFRFVWRHRPAFDISFYPELGMFACTIEVIETKYLIKAQSATGANGSTSSTSHTTSSARPFSVYLPLAFHIDQCTLHRWDVPDRIRTGTTKKYTPIIGSSVPPTFPSLADAIQFLLQTPIEQLAAWWSSPYIAPAVVTHTPTSTVHHTPLSLQADTNDFSGSGFKNDPLFNP